MYIFIYITVLAKVIMQAKFDGLSVTEAEKLLIDNSVNLDSKVYHAILHTYYICIYMHVYACIYCLRICICVEIIMCRCIYILCHGMDICMLLAYMYICKDNFV